ncbi:MAG TPA: glycine betaine ABC transporter substrate-binding protein, partial [bacterium]|nr:glycine betaine ABC transporter substrate-binding protein [bacterium]
LLRGEIDAYAEYTGTIRQEILGGEALPEGGMADALAERGVVMGDPLGFNNTYALGMRKPRAAELGVTRISDLAAHPDLRLAFTNEFMDRGDGWPALRDRYALPHAGVRGIDHDLAYRALAGGSIDVTDLYSTDAEIRQYDLHVLKDDLAHFPEYRAVVLRRADLAERAPHVVRAFDRLSGAISDGDMTAMNARAKIDREPEGRVAAAFLAERLGVSAEARVETAAGRLLRHTREHLLLFGVSLAAAILIGVPLGTLAAKVPSVAQPVLAVTGIFQTVPSLAILVLLIGPLGLGAPPAIAALFLYSLLPIVRNTHAGLEGIPPEIRESATALGLTAGARLRFVELPMASRSILAGIKTAAVINVGTATLAALVGAGGYGQPIFTGIRLDDGGLVLQGAVPAAALALAVQGLFELAERGLVPKGLRLSASD